MTNIGCYTGAFTILTQTSSNDHSKHHLKQSKVFKTQRTMDAVTMVPRALKSTWINEVCNWSTWCCKNCIEGTLGLAFSLLYMWPLTSPAANENTVRLVYVHLCLCFKINSHGGRFCTTRERKDTTWRLPTGYSRRATNRVLPHPTFLLLVQNMQPMGSCHVASSYRQFKHAVNRKLPCRVFLLLFQNR